MYHLFSFPSLRSSSHLVFQMHYTNPNRLSNIIDSSGASLGLTTKLRKYDGGFMRLGPVEYQSLIRIPPRKVSP